MFKATSLRIEKRQSDSYKFVDATTYAVLSGASLLAHIEKEIAAAELRAQELREACAALSKDMQPVAPRRGAVRPKRYAPGATGRTEERRGF